MAMNERKNIIMLFKTPMNVLVWKVGHKTYVLLSRFRSVYFEANGQNHSILGSYKFLRIAWHDIFSLSHNLLASWNYPPCCGVEEQMLIFSSGLTPGRVKGS